MPVYFIIPVILALFIGATLYSKFAVARVNNMSPEERIAQINKYFGSHFELEPGEHLIAASSGTVYSGPLIPEQHYSTKDAAKDMAKNAAYRLVGVNRTVHEAAVSVGVTNRNRVVVAVEEADQMSYPSNAVNLFTASEAFPGQDPGKRPSAAHELTVIRPRSGDRRLGVWLDTHSLKHFRNDLGLAPRAATAA